MVPNAEAERIQRVLAGDRAAFVALYEELLPIAWRRATREGDAREAIERRVRSVLTHVFLRLAASPPQEPLADRVRALAARAAAGRLRAPGVVEAPPRAVSATRAAPGSRLRAGPSPTP